MIDLFSGGSNVGANTKANKIISIDSQKELIRLFNSFKEHEKEKVFFIQYLILLINMICPSPLNMDINIIVAVALKD